MPLSPEDPVVAIDARVAKRRSGRSKGPEAHQVLADALGIETVGQLLHHYPRRYIDRSRVLPIAKLPIDAYATVIATVRSVAKRQTRRRQAMVTVTIGDGDVFLVPRGYHGPSVASPNHDLYYLNVLAGPGAERTMAFCDDPQHHWIRETWGALAPDPRVPVTSAKGRVR